MKVLQSLLGFKDKKTTVLQQRNSLVKLLIIINIPNVILLYLFNTILTEPYMDQQFHYDQFLKYHSNQFHYWNQKITTPPGLYYVQRIFTTLVGSNIAQLRAINSLFFSNLFVIFALKIYDFQDPCLNNLSRALNLALSPTIYFFNFLDYTDAASVALVTIMFYYNLVKSEWRLALVSLVAIFIRQNNIIWMLYLIIYKVLGDHKKTINQPKSFFSHIFTIIKIFLTNKGQIIMQNKLQIVIVGVFVGYLRQYNNGKLVFGDHSHHQFTFHPNQMLYLSLFCFLNLPITLGQYISAVNSFYQRVYLSRHSLSAYLFILSISIIIVDQFTKIHPFILADNRHYTFYLYRYLIQISSIKFLLCLSYAFCFNFLYKLIVSSEIKMIRFILWLGASFGYLAFGELVQFRYFAIPFLMFSFDIENKNFSIDVEGVHKDQSSFTNKEKMIWTTLIKVFINFVVFAVFLFAEFNNQYGRGRLMW